MKTRQGRFGQSSPRPSLPLHARLAALILVSTICLGCASSNVNPPMARANTGYVDIFDPEGGSWSWSIEDPRGGPSFYTEYKPQTGIVRLALSPGSYEFGIAILNTAISKPPAIKVQVVNGQLAPVRVLLSEEGATAVERKHTQVPGRYLRRTKITGDKTQIHRLDAEVLPSIPYRCKEQVPYAFK
jgi:hypothetical protein